MMKQLETTVDAKVLAAIPEEEPEEPRLTQNDIEGIAHGVYEERYSLYETKQADIEANRPVPLTQDEITTIVSEHVESVVKDDLTELQE